MSSADLQSALISIQQNDYQSLALIVAVGYDYILTFPKEIEYIWGRPWTRVSTSYIFVRYCGLYCLVFVEIVGSSFLPGPTKTWLFFLYLTAADYVMILRVWAMYNRSRRILTILLVLFSAEIISIILFGVIASDLDNMSASISQVLNLSSCAVYPNSPIWAQVSAICQVALGIVMCMLAIIQYVRQLLQMYSVTKQWELSRYMNMLVKQGILYFIGVLLVNLIILLGLSGKLPSGNQWALLLLNIATVMPLYSLTPRFIISMRELYARDLRGRRTRGIDTAFGLSSLGSSAGGTAIEFAGVGQDEEPENVEQLPM